MKKNTLVLSLFILLAMLSLLPSMLIPVHASIGIVCLADPSSTSCPSGNATLSGSVGEQLRVAVLLQGSDLVNGFDITTIVDRSIIAPVGVDLTGSILTGTSSPTILSECLNGTPPFIPPSNAECIANIPSILGTIEFSVSACPGCFATMTTGLLFTEIYNISGTAPEIPIAFLTGCKQTSVPNTCVSLSNGTKTPVPETAQSSSFGNSSSPDFVITAYPNIVTVPAGTSTNLTISVRSIAGFLGQVNLSALPVFGFVWTVNPANVTLAPGQAANATVTAFAFTGLGQGKYVGRISGTCGSITHSLGLGATVVLGPDFMIVPNGFALSILGGSSAVLGVTVISVRGFTGTVRLFVSPVRVGLTISPNPKNVTLASGENVTTSFVVSTSTTTSLGFYLVDVTGNVVEGNVSGLTQTAEIAVFVEGFVISTGMQQITLTRGTQASSNLLLKSVGGFVGMVNLSVTISPEKRHAPGVSFGSDSVTLSSDMTSLVQFVISTDKNTRPGIYLVSITCSSGAFVVSTDINLVVTT